MQEGEFVEVAESSIESDSDLSDIKVVEQDRRFTARIMRKPSLPDLEKCKART